MDTSFTPHSPLVHNVRRLLVNVVRGQIRSSCVSRSARSLQPGLHTQSDTRIPRVAERISHLSTMDSHSTTNPTIPTCHRLEFCRVLNHSRCLPRRFSSASVCCFHCVAMAAPFVFSTTGRTILDPTRSHLTVSLSPAVPRSSTAPYAPAHCVDNKQHYVAKGVGWDRWADERWTEKNERAWMGEVKHSDFDKQEQLNRSRQYREYTMQQQHFAATTQSSTALATTVAAPAASTNTTTSYAAIGSHYRSSLAVDSTTAIEPPSTLNTSTFESSSKRLGMDPNATGSYVSCYGGDYKERQTGSGGSEAETRSSELLTASYALGYGRNHRHHRMAVNRSTGSKAIHEEEEKEQLDETQLANASGEMKVERIAQGLGYAEKHINYYKYLGRKQPRAR